MNISALVAVFLLFCVGLWAIFNPGYWIRVVYKNAGLPAADGDRSAVWIVRGLGIFFLCFGLFLLFHPGK